MKPEELWSELIGILKLSNVWVFVQLINRSTRTKISCTKTQTLSNLRLHFISDYGKLQGVPQLVPQL